MREPASAPDVAAMTGRVAALLHEVAETHHRVYRITDGADADWASWYAHWLAEPVGAARRARPAAGAQRDDLPVGPAGQGSHRAGPDEPWDEFYARRITAELAA